VGYTLYSSSSTRVHKEEEFTGEEKDGKTDELHQDVIVPTLRGKLFLGKIKFFTLEAGSDSWDPFVLHSVGNTDFKDLLPNDRCLIVFSSDKDFIWSPEGASQKDKAYFDEHATEYLKRVTNIPIPAVEHLEQNESPVENKCNVL